jgi:hypothetical protein
MCNESAMVRRLHGPVEIKKGGNAFVFPPLSLPFRNWIQPVMEGPPRAGTIAGFGSAAFRHAESSLISSRRLMFPNCTTVECLPFFAFPPLSPVKATGEEELH